MSTISRDTGKRNSIHKLDSNGVSQTMAVTSRDSGTITIGTVGNPGKSTTPKLVTGTIDAGSLVFSAGHIAAGADKAVNVADNWDSTYKQSTTE